MVIDTHTHIRNEKDYKSYARKAGKRKGKMLTLPLYNDDLDGFLAFTQTKNDLYPIGTVNMKDYAVPQIARLKDLFAAGRIYGVKLYPGYQYFYPTDEPVVEIARLCADFRKPLIFHSGDVLADAYDERPALLKYSQSIHIDELANVVPECTIVIAHFGFPYFLQTANIVSKNTNVYTDISGTIEECDNKQEMKALLKYYAEDLIRAFAYFPQAKKKTMFGTDFYNDDSPLSRVSPYFELADKVFRKNERSWMYSGLADTLFF